MTLKIVGALTLLAVLAGISVSCSRPAAQTQAAQTPAQTDVAAPGPAATTTIPVADTAPAASVAGEYEGDFDDGSGAAVTISGSAPRYTVHVIVGGDGCGGGALGPAQVSSAGVLTVRPSDDASCTITMTPTAHGFSLQENQCSHLHGDTCGFSGEVHRKH
jgi:hypothetical protein